MPRRFPLLLLACACQSGSTVDVQLLSTPTTTLSQLSLTLDTTGVVHHEVVDGGSTALPATLRVLADGDSLTVTARAFDGDGGFRTQTGTVTLASGKIETLPLDLSNQQWCPAGPLLPGEQVLYGSEDGGDVTVFGYAPQPFSQPNDPALACSGNVCAQYIADQQYSSGMGLQFAAPGKYKHVSFRFWASASSQWSFFFTTAGSPGMAYVFPDPSFCTSNQLACASTIGPVWQRIEFDVPASIPDTVGLQFQLVSVPSAPITARFDDVRVIP